MLLGMLTPEKIKDAKRLKQIANVLLRHGLGYAVERLELKSYLTFHKRLQKEEFSKPITSLPERLRKAMESLGGTFVKIGQMLSMRHDLLPKEYCDEFSKLQDNVAPLPFKVVKKVIETELGASLGHFFKEFDKTPIASASVGQVHKAKLKTGEIVAVKVQRPRIEEIFAADIDILYYLAKLINHYFPETKGYNLKMIIEEFESYTKKELDYIHEARNIEVFYNNFKDDPNVTVPKVFWEYTTKKVLTMSFVSGVKISEVEDFAKMHSTTEKTTDVLLNCMMKQFFDYRVFHADPHPGNVFLVGHNKIALLDFGIVGRLSPEMVEEMEDIVIGLVKADLDMIADAFLKLGLTEAEFDAKRFKEDLLEKFGEYYDASLKQINFASFFSSAFEMARKYNIILPLNFTLLAKSLMTLQGFCVKYAPNFNMITYIEPYAKKMLRERTQPKYILSSLRRTAADIKDFMVSFPSDLSNLIKAIKYGTRVNLDISNKDIMRLTLELDRTSDRLVFGMIIAALIVACAILIQAKVEPLIKGIPLLAYIGFAIILWLSVLLTVSILKGNK